MGGWSRVPPLTPLTFTEIGFAGPFFTPAPENQRPGNPSRMRGRNLFRGRRGGLAALPDGMSPRCTCDRPAMYLASGGAGQGVNSDGLPRSVAGAAGRAPPGRAAAGPSAWCIAGPRPVHGGSIAGRRGGYRRSTSGRRGLAGWGSVPVRLADLEPCMDHHATPPAATGTARYPAGPLDALDAADAAFR